MGDEAVQGQFPGSEYEQHNEPKQKMQAQFLMPEIILMYHQHHHSHLDDQRDQGDSGEKPDDHQKSAAHFRENDHRQAQMTAEGQWRDEMGGHV